MIHRLSSDAAEPPLAPLPFCRCAWKTTQWAALFFLFIAAVTLRIMYRLEATQFCAIPYSVGGCSLLILLWSDCKGNMIQFPVRVERSSHSTRKPRPTRHAARQVPFLRKTWLETPLPTPTGELLPVPNGSFDNLNPVLVADSVPSGFESLVSSKELRDLAKKLEGVEEEDKLKSTAWTECVTPQGKLTPTGIALLATGDKKVYIKTEGEFRRRGSSLDLSQSPADQVLVGLRDYLSPLKLI